MQMISAVAPEVSRRHPRAVIILDNLHMMYDIISNILVSPTIPEDRKREAIYQQLAEFRSPHTNVIPLVEWREMAAHMGGVAAMGGPAVGVLAPVSPAKPAAPAPPGDHRHH